jgi:hypothetical protein
LFYTSFIQFCPRKVLQLKRGAFLLLVFALLPLVSISQTDSLPKHGTIKIGKAKDSTYIKAEMIFYKFSDSDEKENIKNVSYSDFVNANRPVVSNRTSPAYPSTGSQKNPNFDYTAYFYSHPLTKKIDLGEKEIDTVKLLVQIDKKGNVHFMDMAPTQKIGKTIVIYDSKSKSYIVDILHYNVNLAMRQLTNKKWHPAFYHKTKRGKFKNATVIKPFEQKLNTTGILTILFSSTPLE